MWDICGAYVAHIFFGELDVSCVVDDTGFCDGDEGDMFNDGDVRCIRSVGRNILKTHFQQLTSALFRVIPTITFQSGIFSDIF